MWLKKLIILVVLLLIGFSAFAQRIATGGNANPSVFTIARLKYGVGGDWYWGSSAIPNMLKFLKENTNIPVNEEEVRVSIPDKDLVELPFSHGIYHCYYDFPDGLPKIHKHDGKPPQGFGIFHEGRLVVFYDYECDIGDGWEDPQVYNDPPEKREAALKMGVNIITWVLEN
jgi:hypothetical protein